MAKGHSYLWRRPGRRDEERKQFAALMPRVEAVRIRRGMSKTELAAELGGNVDGVRGWMTGRTVGRKEVSTKSRHSLRGQKRRSDNAPSEGDPITLYFD
jgi:ribosome-binding protein aMBF1 (putative translation factor)